MADIAERGRVGYPIDDIGSLRIYDVKYPGRITLYAGDNITLPHRTPRPYSNFSSHLPSVHSHTISIRTVKQKSAEMSFKNTMTGFPSLRSTISAGRLTTPRFNPQFGRELAQRGYSTYQAPRSAFRKWSTRLR